MKKKIAVLVPARYRSKRLPKKPIFEIDGQKLIVRTVYNLNKYFDSKDIYVVTDHKEIANSLKDAKCNVILNKKTFLNGTERCSYALKFIKKKYDYYLIASCDNPFLDKNIFKFLTKKINLIKEKVDAITIHTKISSKNALNKNIAKIIVSKDNDVIYISRLRIPYIFKEKKITFYSHHGLVLFTRKLLKGYNALHTSDAQYVEDNEWLKLIFNKKIFKSYFYRHIEPEINTKKDIKEYFPIKIFK